ncbi:MAG: dienelactone hydrolase [Spirochaetae bacterium HGW-Spirochaetae-5]|nr:MAG: dienelactone hydrolase [Spirochaetae bacterium HGW-Spirochaetae-5]
MKILTDLIKYANSAVTIVLTGIFIITANGLNAKIVTQTVEYKYKGTVFEGYLAYDDELEGKRPGVLIVHQWMGLKDYEKMRAEQIAALGYTAFAIDIYGKGVRASNREEASKLATIYRSDRKLMRERAQTGFDTLKKMKNIDSSQIAAMGYCFGGGVVLELARSGADVAGVISFHGSYNTPNPDDAKKIKGRVLAIHGADDPAIPLKELESLQNEMRNAKVDHKIIIYGGAVHSFTDKAAGNDPSKGSAYNQKADEGSWEDMKRFYKEIFKR